MVMREHSETGPTQIAEAVLSASDTLGPHGSEDLITLAVDAPGDIKEQPSSRKCGLQVSPLRWSSKGSLHPHCQGFASRSLHFLLALHPLPQPKQYGGCAQSAF